MADTEIIHESDAVHRAFGLSYANYLVLHRTLLQSMPDEWQTRFVALINEYNAAFAHVETPDTFEVTAGTDCYVNELTPDQLAQVGITVNEHWDDEDGETTYTDAQGNAIDGGDHVVVPCPDPVPHYRRGRAYVAPRTGTEDTGV